MKAVILAAGMGSRIREHHDLPKGFIFVGEQSIITESILKLKWAGITDILIITGYNASYYDALAENDAAITTHFNAAYHKYGSLYSLYCAKDWVTEDFLVLESDILYEARAIDHIFQDQHANAILLSHYTYSEDEVYVEAQQQQLVNMSKQKTDLNAEKIYGEFVGINKLCLPDYYTFMRQLEDDRLLLETGHYETDGFVAMSKHLPIYCLKMPDLVWCEIDNTFHLERAKKFYPKITQAHAKACAQRTK